MLVRINNERQITSIFSVFWLMSVSTHGISMQVDRFQINRRFLQWKVFGCAGNIHCSHTISSTFTLEGRWTIGLCDFWLPQTPASRQGSQVVFFRENFIKCWPNIVSILSKASHLTSQVRFKKRRGRAGREGGGRVLTIDSLFQMLFIILSRNTDMCLLKGDTVPLTLNLNAFLIWDASWGSKTNSLWVVVRGRGVAGFIYETCGKFWHHMLEPLLTCYMT